MTFIVPPVFIIFIQLWEQNSFVLSNFPSPFFWRAGLGARLNSKFPIERLKKRINWHSSGREEKKRSTHTHTRARFQRRYEVIKVTSVGIVGNEPRWRGGEIKRAKGCKKIKLSTLTIHESHGRTHRDAIYNPTVVLLLPDETWINYRLR